MGVLEVKNVTKVYKGKGAKRDIVAVNNLSFEVNEGEIVGFIGPNGAGKSTMLKIITGLAHATKGKVFICGKDVEKERISALSHIGTIVENPDMYLDWTGEGNLLYFMSLQYTPEKTKEEKEARVEELLKMVGLYDRRKSRIRTYSLGMKQRLGIAQALLARPALLVLDEPTNGLDPEGIKEVRDILKELAEKYNMAILVSSHLLAEMQIMCSRFIIIDKGIKVSDLMPEQVNKETRTYILTTDDVVKAKDVLKEKFDILGTVVAEGKVEFSTDIPSGDIAKNLILNDVAVLGFGAKEKSLEEMFIQATHAGKEE